MLNEIIKLIIKSLLHRKLRAYLTIIGIIIGVTALISLMTLGQGLEDGLTKQFDKFGVRRIFIASKVVGSFGPPSGIGTITEKDVDTLNKLSFLEFVQPLYRDSAEVKYNRETYNTVIFGPDPKDMRAFFEEVGRSLDEGRYLQDGDSKVAMIGYGLAKDQFGKEIPLKGSIDIEGVKFRIIAILAEEGSSQNDYAIYIPIDDLRELKGKPDAMTAITAQVAKGYDVEEAAIKIERALKRERNDENFVVTNPKKIKEQTGAILGVVKWVVSAIAFISLLVGGIGIMNSMYTSVLERTREIGVMKAIGAKNSDILTMYIIESGTMGLIGGIIGILLGLLISYGAGGIINSIGVVNISLSLDYKLIIFGTVFSFGLGMISGVLPAIRASKLKPVDALRYE